MIVHYGLLYRKSSSGAEDVTYYWSNADDLPQQVLDSDVAFVKRYEGLSVGVFDRINNLISVCTGKKEEEVLLGIERILAESKKEQIIS